MTTSVVTAPHCALWCVCENKVVCELGHCGVDTPQLRISEGVFIFCLFVLNRHGHADVPVQFFQENLGPWAASAWDLGVFRIFKIFAPLADVNN